MLTHSSRLSFSLVFVLGCLAPLHAQDPAAAKQLATEAEQALVAGDWEAAIARAQAALEADDECLPAYLVLGGAWEGRGDHERAAFAYDSGYYSFLLGGAEGELDRLLELRDAASNSAARPLLAEAGQAFAARQLAPAKELAQRAAELPGKARAAHREACLLLARVQLAAAEFEAARATLAELLEHATSQVRIEALTLGELEALRAVATPLLAESTRAAVAGLLAQARQALERHDRDGVLAPCERIHALEEEDPESWLLAGQAHLEAADWSQAVECLSRAKSRGADHAALMPLLSQAVDGEVARFATVVAAEADQGERERRRVELRLAEAELYELLDDHERAFAVLDQELEGYPAGGLGTWLRHARAALHLRRGQAQAALADYRALFEAEMEEEQELSAATLSDFLRAARMLGDERALIETSDLIEQLGRGAGTSPAHVLFQERAKLRLAAGQREAALVDYEIAFQLDPWTLELARERFDLLVSLGRRDSEPRSLKLILPTDPQLALEYGPDALRAFLLARDYEGLVLVGDAILRTQPDNALGHWMRGLGLKSVEEGLAEATRALELGWDPAAVHAERAYLYGLLGQLEHAAEEILAAVPGTQELKKVLPVLRRYLDEEDAGLPIVRTLECLTQALPECAEAWLALGHARLKRESARTALPEFEHARALDPRLEEAHEQCGWARYLALNEGLAALLETEHGNAQAKALCDQAIAELERAGPVGDVELEMARTLRSQLEQPEYQSHSLEGSRKVLAEAQRLAERGGEAAEIVRLCDEAERLSPAVWDPRTLRLDARILRASQLVRSARYSQALEDLAWVGLYARGELEAQVTQQTRATLDAGCSALEKAIRKAPEDVEVLLERARLSHAAAAGRVEGGSWNSALEHAQAVLAVDAERAEAHVLSGQALEALRRRTLACQHYDRALAIDPGDQTARDRQVALREALGDIDWLIAHCTRALEAGASAALLIRRAECYLTKLDGTRARADLESASRLGTGPIPILLFECAAVLDNPQSASSVLGATDEELAHSPLPAELRTLRAYAYYAQEDYQACLDEYVLCAVEDDMVDVLAFQAALRCDLPFALALAERRVLASVESDFEYLRAEGKSEEEIREWAHAEAYDDCWMRAEAEAAEKVGDWERALHALERLQAFVVAPDEKLALEVRLAVALAHAGRTERALALAPGDTVHERIARSEVLRIAQRFEAALLEAQAAALAAGRLAEPHVQEGRVRLQLRQYDQARSCFERALAIAPRSAAALCGLGRVAFELDPTGDEALARLSESIALDPTDTEARIARYLAQAARGRPELASEDLRYAVLEDPFSSALGPSARDDVAHWMITHGQLTRAIAFLSEWLLLDPGSRTRILKLRALAYDLRGRSDDDGYDRARADEDIRGALETDPEDASLLFWAGTLLSNAEQRLDALHRCIQLDPDNPQAYVSRAYVRVQIGDRIQIDGAIADAAQAISLDPGNPAAFALIVEIHDQLGNYDLAWMWSQTARQHHPKLQLPSLERSLAIKLAREQESERVAVEKAEEQAKLESYARMSAESEARKRSESESLTRFYRPDDGLSRATAEFWENQRRFGTNYRDYQGAAQELALGRAIQASRSPR